MKKLSYTLEYHPKIA